MIRFGLIGCSGIAKRSIIPAFSKSNKARIDIIGSRDTHKSKELSLLIDDCKYGDYQDVLNSDVDAVYISTPNSTHEKWAVEVANTHKHIIVEKPAALSLKSAERIINACEKNNVKIMEGFMYRFHPQHQAARTLIKFHKIGDVLEIKGCFGYPFPREGNIRLSKELGGGVLNDAICYPIHVARILFNEEPTKAYCNLYIDSNYNIDTSCNVLLFFSDNKTAYISGHFGAEYQNKYEIWGRKGIINVNRAFAVKDTTPTKLLLTQNDIMTEYNFNAINQYTLMIDKFCAHIFGDDSTDYGDDLLKQARVMDMCKHDYTSYQIERL